jgi:hypothetical protein
MQSSRMRVLHGSHARDLSERTVGQGNQRRASELAAATFTRGHCGASTENEPRHRVTEAAVPVRSRSSSALAAH